MLLPFSVARVNDPSWIGLVCAVPANTFAGRLGQPLPCDECVRKALWSGRTGGPVAWQPPHRQDEDLVPLMAGACSPCRRSSRRIPGQTSGPDPRWLLGASPAG